MINEDIKQQLEKEYSSYFIIFLEENYPEVLHGRLFPESLENLVLIPAHEPTVFSEDRVHTLLALIAKMNIKRKIIWFHDTLIYIAINETDKHVLKLMSNDMCEWIDVKKIKDIIKFKK